MHASRITTSTGAVVTAAEAEDCAITRAGRWRWMVWTSSACRGGRGGRSRKRHGGAAVRYRPAKRPRSGSLIRADEQSGCSPFRTNLDILGFADSAPTRDCSDSSEPAVGVNSQIEQAPAPHSSCQQHTRRTAPDCRASKPKAESCITEGERLRASRPSGPWCERLVVGRDVPSLLHRVRVRAGPGHDVRHASAW
jgi:hypothetical protein